MATERHRLIKLIHVAKRELNLDDASYRAILMRIGNAQSAADLSVSKLQEVLDYLKSCGFKVRPKGKKFTRPLAQDKESKKIRAMWLFMHNIGIVRDPSERALSMYVKRLTKVEALQWLNGTQTLLVIESLKKWVMRILPDKTKKLQAEVLAMNLPNDVYQRVAQLPWNYGSYDKALEVYEILERVAEQYKGVQK